MNAGTIGLVTGVAGFFLGGYAVFVATDARRHILDDVEDTSSSQDQESMEALAEQYRGLQESVDRCAQDR